MRKRIRQLERAAESHLATVKLSSCRLDAIDMPTNGRQLIFDARIHTKQGPQQTIVLTDTGASAMGFVDANFVKLHKIPTVALAKPVKLRLADDNLAPNITHMAQVSLLLGDHREELWCMITSLGKFGLILGMPWIEHHDVQISGKSRSLTFNSEDCLRNCIHNRRPVTVFSKGTRSRDRKAPEKPNPGGGADIAEITASAFMKMVGSEKNQVIAMWPEHFEMLDRPEELDKYLIGNTLTADVAAITAEDYEKFMTKIKKEPLTTEQLFRRVPKCFHKYIQAWNHAEANKIPPRRKWDHRIDLIPGAKPPAKKAYGLSREQASVVKKYVDEMLGKGFIRPSHSPYAAPVLIVKKPEGGLRVCIDYRALNALTIKNRNAPPLIRETLARLCSAKYFSKFDIIAAFNEIRMREGDEEKTAFLTRYGLFEYVVMPFGLCNAPGTFQAFINDTLREYLDEFCSGYLDDILIYSDTYEDHVTHVSKVLERLIEAGLFLDIDKCEFFVQEVKYLGLIITTDGVKMDPRKIEAIVDWKEPRCIKDIQAFLGFCNFYRKFIHNYSAIAVPLSKLTRDAEKTFAFPWASGSTEDNAFRALKEAFLSANMLAHFDPDLETWIESDASDYVVAAVLSQRNKEGVIRPVAFMSKKMSPAECNYEIYDKELLAIIRAFEEWRPECAGTPVEDPVKILTDHRNLEHFMTSKQLNRRQARWAEFLSEFNFHITYRPGVQGTKPDSLTRRSQDLPTNDDDPRKQHQYQTLLKSKHLDKGVRAAIAAVPRLMDEAEESPVSLAAMLYDLSEEGPEESETARAAPADVPDPGEQAPGAPVVDNEPADDAPAEDAPEVNAHPEDLIDRIRQAYPDDEVLQRIMEAKRTGLRRIPVDLTREGVRLELGDCEISDELFWVKDRLYVPDDEPLQAALIKHIHESPPGGHAGRAVTYDRISTHYYWPRMTSTVAQYVKACHPCKRTKAYREGKHGLLKPLPIPERYWQDISVDFITPLPLCLRNGRRFRHILVVVDRLSKKRKFIPMDSLEVDAVVQAFVEWIWREEGYPATIISDRGTQFVNHFWARLCARIGTKPKLSTSFHPETDGQTENANAALKQYLRAYCNYNQDDWVDHLPIAEFEANSAKSSTAGVEPFLATKGYIPHSGLEPARPITGPPHERREIRNADAFIKKLEALRVYLRDELKWSQAKMEEQANRDRHPAPEFRVGDKVMLDARYIKTVRPNNSLDYKNLGPYEITRAINNSAYELDLPEAMNSLFNVFHPWLLHLDDGRPLRGQIEDPPPEIEIDGEVEYPVEAIIDSRIDGRKNDPRTGLRGCLQYRIKFTGYDTDRHQWQDWIDAEHAPDLVADFHHKYPEKAGPHASFVRPADWTPEEANPQE